MERRSRKTKENGGMEMQYLLNAVSDSVRIWTLSSGTASTIPTTSSAFPAGQLVKTITSDEHGKQIVEYKDKEGKVLLKKVQLASSPGTAHVGWLCTYYVYDDLNNLRFVMQPNVLTALHGAGNWTISTTMRDELCFYYGYDHRNRMIIKKVPGAGEVYMVYDNRDRLVMTQDANLRAAAKWLATLYDELNRPVQTGLLKNNYWSGSKTFDQHRTDAGSSTTYPFAISSPPSSTYWEMLTETHYDDYNNVPSGLSSSLNTIYIISSNFFTTYNAYPDYAQQITQSTSVRGLATWTKVKVLGTTSTYLASVSIYDAKGRLIQVQSSNITGGLDIATTQYDFSGKVLRTHLKHQKSGTNAQEYQVLTKLAYDHGGRVLNIKKKLTSGSTAHVERTIAQMSYDELGQLKKKEIGQKSGGGALDSLVYDYNIRGWMLGMNRGYAKSTSSTANYFGFDLGYDKTPIASLGSYIAAQYNGNIGGMAWKSTGDDEIRKYDFTYDAVNRILKADFNQYTSSSFNKNAGIDFTMTMGNGTDPATAYDGNGNIKAMKHRGLKIGSSVTIDSLTYNYTAYSNKLLNVIDGVNDAQTKLGDFRTSTLHPGSGSKTTSTTDYTYDVNGNMVKDLNKDIITYAGANGIVYNHLNLPSNITVRAASANKGTIEYTYDATGNKLKKVTTEGSIVTTTLYSTGFVYRNDTLEFASHEEGRIRKKDTACVYDYFVKDHLGNVRMVLTEEAQTDQYPAASMETAQATTEETFYTNLSATRVDKPSGYPTDNYTNPNNKVAKVRGDGNKIGPAIVLKVMAGDKFNLYTSSWYKLNGATPGTPANPLTDLLAALSGSIGGISGGHVTSSELSTSGVLSPGATSFLNSHSGYTTSKPKAFVNWVLFDEQFKYVSSNSGFEQVGNDTTFTTHTRTNQSIDKNGYLYIYVSNETPNIDVFFDNLQVTHIRGQILEETHYYPFGLTMKGISSKFFKGTSFIENNLKFNEGTELNTTFDIHFYETNYRSLDPQIGRFWQLDPIAEGFENISPYVFVENNPILMNDPFGLAGDTVVLPEVILKSSYKKLDSENGQVLPPASFWERLWDGGNQRTWNGHSVDKEGYVHPGISPPVIFEVPDFGRKKATTQVATKILVKVGNNRWLVYRAYKKVKGRLTLYIGKAKTSLKSRYGSGKKVDEMFASAIDKLDNLPDNATALGVEQAIFNLNGGKGVLSNIRNPTVREAYVQAGEKFLNENIPNWKELFVFPLFK